VTDRDPDAPLLLHKLTWEELDREVAQLSTSSARREREFLESAQIRADGSEAAENKFQPVRQQEQPD